MSRLEDIYMEDDDGANDLERIVEGDEGSEPRNSDGDDDNNSHSEAEEAPQPVDPTAASEKKAKVVRNPRAVLNPKRLTGPRGIQTIEGFFKDFKFLGKGYEKEDLNMVMKKMEHWAHRLYPKFQFDDCIDKIASLGIKKEVNIHIRKIRLGMIYEDDGIVRQSDSEDEATPPAPPLDEFDLLLDQQIALARSTPASNAKSMKNNIMRDENESFFAPNRNENFNSSNFSTPIQAAQNTKPSTPQLTEEQKARMLKNRMLAEERRLARMKENMLKEKEAMERSPSGDQTSKKNDPVVESSDKPGDNLNSSLNIDIDDIQNVLNKSQQIEAENKSQQIETENKSQQMETENKSQQMETDNKSQQMETDNKSQQMETENESEVTLNPMDQDVASNS